jgi:hypothetical protein
MTARELYRNSAEFKGFIQFWARRRTAPRPFIDWLEERGHPKLAACVKWCTEQAPAPPALGKTAPCPVYPRDRKVIGIKRADRRWAWFVLSHGNRNNRDSDDLPGELFAIERVVAVGIGSVAEALVVMLDAWNGG